MTDKLVKTGMIEGFFGGYDTIGIAWPINSEQLLLFYTGKKKIHINLFNLNILQFESQLSYQVTKILNSNWSNNRWALAASLGSAPADNVLEQIKNTCSQKNKNDKKIKKNQERTTIN